MLSDIQCISFYITFKKSGGMKSKQAFLFYIF